MLRTYQKLEDVPEALREHYVESNGVFVAQLDKDHPVLANNTQLKSEKESLQRRLRTVTDEKTQLEGNSLPEGHVPVTAADKALLDKVKAMGDEAKITEAVTEYPKVKERVEEAERDTVYGQAAEANGYTNVEAFKAAARAHKLKVEMKDGKPFVGDKSLSDYVEATPDLKALSGAFVQGQAKRGMSTDPPPKGNTTVYDRQREEVKKSAPQESGQSWLAKRFGRAASNA